MRSIEKQLIVFLALALATGCFQVSNGQEAEFSANDLEFFENRIRPLLEEHCLQCHGRDPEKLRGGLRLTSREGVLAGGDSGPAVVPGKPGESLLMSAVRYETFEMPPKGRLTGEQIGLLEKWIQIGAPDPRTTASRSSAELQLDIEDGKQFWAFQPIRKPLVPGDLENSDWPITELDAFILKRLEENQLRPVGDADRATLLRRVYFALIGLPPEEQAIDDFVNSTNSLDQDLADIVDQLLASPHFGERWGRHWLDVARFAESSGGGRSLMFPDAWRFRDYVIRSYNIDKPFDQFIREQIAGDLLPFESHYQHSNQIIATGFLALGPTNYEQQDKELLNMEVIDEQVDTIGRSFLALTLGCARCHDHKFDPIPTRDYYALAGIFKNTRSLVDGNVSSYVERSLATDAETAAVQKYNQEVAKLTKRLNQAVAQVEALSGTVEQETRQPVRNVTVQQLPGIVIDNTAAKLAGTWKDSVAVPQYVGAGYLHDDGQPKGKNFAVFEPQLSTGGQYEVRMSYSAGGNRASNVPVTINHQDGVATKIINQSQDPPIGKLFVSLGTYRFEANNVASVKISNDDTDGVVIVDAIQFLYRDETEAATATTKSALQLVEVAVEPAIPQGKLESPELIAARKQVIDLNQQLKELKQNTPRPVAKAMSVEEVPEPKNGHIHIRGGVRNLGDVVQRGFIRVVCGETTPAIPDQASGRLELANWIADADHPLTSRVYVNRVWRHLFGKGLVETTDNFGKMGQVPSHPELLDFLARKFTEEGWSTKQLIREILLSHVFRLGTDPDSKCLELDPENRLLWRANPRRVDAEVLRDSMLAVSGTLDLKQGGFTIRKLEQYDLNYTFETSRRSVYVPAFRNSMLDLFEVFDIANPNLVVGNRNTSILPTQALFLMNSPWVVEQSRAAARRLFEDGPENQADQTDMLELAFRRTLGRKPTPEELKLSTEFLDSFGDAEPEAAWASLFHALFASLDFRFVN